jgi:hypothetical protein
MELLVELDELLRAVPDDMLGSIERPLYLTSDEPESPAS